MNPYEPPDKDSQDQESTQRNPWETADRHDQFVKMFLFGFLLFGVIAMLLLPLVIFLG
ncbi:MAG: hypothetical protein AAF958_10225 [Planctomycetota bacterium]